MRVSDRTLGRVLVGLQPHRQTAPRRWEVRRGGLRVAREASESSAKVWESKAKLENRARRFGNRKRSLRIAREASESSAKVWEAKNKPFHPWSKALEIAAEAAAMATMRNVDDSEASRRIPKLRFGLRSSRGGLPSLLCGSEASSTARPNHSAGSSGCATASRFHLWRNVATGHHTAGLFPAAVDRGRRSAALHPAALAGGSLSCAALHVVRWAAQVERRTARAHRRGRGGIGRRCGCLPGAWVETGHAAMPGPDQITDVAVCLTTQTPRKSASKAGGSSTTRPPWPVDPEPAPPAGSHTARRSSQRDRAPPSRSEHSGRGGGRGAARGARGAS